MYFCLLVLLAGASWANMPANDHSQRFADNMFSLFTPRTDAKAQEEVGPGDEPGGPEIPTKAEAGLFRSLDKLPAQQTIPNLVGIGNGDFESGPVVWEGFSTYSLPLSIAE